MSVHNLNRRKFIGQASCLALGSTSLLSSVLNLRTIKAMTLDSSTIQNCTNHKALVCLFNSGGLDSFNMLVPTSDSEYATYAAVRSNNALAQASLLPLNGTIGGRTFGLHPTMTNIQSLYNNGEVAFISNVGALVAPITKQEYYDSSVIAPLGLFSHSDQQMHWQTGFAHARDSVGWGGKMADLLTSCNLNQNLSMSMSFSGSNLLQTGNSSVEFSINPWNPISGIQSDYIYDINNPWWYETLKKNTLTNILDATYVNIFEQTYKNTIKTARTGIADVNAALENAPLFPGIFSDNYISNSFKIAAQLIAKQDQLGMKRQVFFIDYGGWDHHDELLNNQEYMLNEVDNAIGEFHQALTSLNKLNDVTTFTLSEFSRTLSSNGNGTDHAWGANAFVMGGAVNGQNIYGTYPTLEENGPLEVGGGVYIPTTAAEEYFSEIALWFGVSPNSLKDLFPNLPNFYSIGGSNPIGFLNY